MNSSGRATCVCALRGTPTLAALASGTATGGDLAGTAGASLGTANAFLSAAAAFAANRRLRAAAAFASAGQLPGAAAPHPAMDVKKRKTFLLTRRIKRRMEV